MQWIDDIHNWHRFRSVQLSLLGGAFGAALTAYGTAMAVAPEVVSGVPHWVLTFLTLGCMGCAFGSAAARAVKQNNLPAKPHANP